MRTFLLELCGQLFQAMGETEGERLTLEIEAPEIEMSSDQAVPLSLIVTEAVTNAIKYAYPAGRRGTIQVRLRRDGDMVELEMRDDGIGIPAGRAETDSGTRDGIGIQLINGFARQLGAMLEVEQGAGTRYVVRMKLRPGTARQPYTRPPTRRLLTDSLAQNPAARKSRLIAGGPMDATLHEKVTAWRRHLHQHPELSLQEKQTSAFVCHTLTRAGRPLRRRRGRPRRRCHHLPRPLEPQRRPPRRHGRAAHHRDHRPRPRLRHPRHHARLRP